MHIPYTIFTYHEVHCGKLRNSTMTNSLANKLSGFLTAKVIVTVSVMILMTMAALPTAFMQDGGESGKSDSAFCQNIEEGDQHPFGATIAAAYEDIDYEQIME